MEGGPSKNHGAYTREASSLTKENVFVSDTRSLVTFFIWQTINLDYQYISPFSKRP